MGKNGCLSYKTQKGGVGQRDAKRGVKEGCRGGVKTHLFLDGCEFRERSTGAQHRLVVINQETLVTAIRGLYEGIRFKMYHQSVWDMFAGVHSVIIQLF